MTARTYSGQRIPVLEGCAFGAVAGEIVIIPKSAASPKDLGIDVKVKGVTVKKELFGMETWGPAVARVKGEINANFLPITSDRSNFVTDSAEYQEFLKAIQNVVAIIEKKLGKEADRGEDRRAGRAVKEALTRIHRALALNPDFSPFGPIPYGEGGGIGGAAAESPAARPDEATVDPEAEGGGAPAGSAAEPEAKPKKKKRRNPLVRKITPNAIVRHIKLRPERGLGLPRLLRRGRAGVLLRGERRLHQPRPSALQARIAEKDGADDVHRPAPDPGDRHHDGDEEPPSGLFPAEQAPQGRLRGFRKRIITGT